MERFQFGFGFVIVAHVLILHFTRTAAERSDKNHVLRLALVLGLWLLQLLFVFIRFNPGDRFRDAAERGMDIRYDEVQARLGYTLERYECPAAAKARQLRKLAETTVAHMQQRAALARASRAADGAPRRSIHSPPTISADDDLHVDSLDEEEMNDDGAGNGEAAAAARNHDSGVAGGVVYMG